MSKGFFLFIVLLIALSCSKSNNNTKPNYIGDYLSTDGVKVTVSKNGQFSKIEWFQPSGSSLIFDSVNVAPDLTFTDNETTTQTIYTPPYSQLIKVVGSGEFKPNAVQFHFTIINGGDIYYSGIK